MKSTLVNFIFYSLLLTIYGCSNPSQSLNSTKPINIIAKHWIGKNSFQEGDYYYFVGTGEESIKEVVSKNSAINDALASVSRIVGFKLSVDIRHTEETDSKTVKLKSINSVNSKNNYMITGVEIDDYFVIKNNNMYKSKVLLKVSNEEIDRLTNDFKEKYLSRIIKGSGIGTTPVLNNKNFAIVKARAMADAIAVSKINSQVNGVSTSYSENGLTSYSSGILKNLKEVKGDCYFANSEAVCEVEFEYLYNPNN